MSIAGRRLRHSLAVILGASLLASGSATAATPTVTELGSTITPGAKPAALTTGADGNVWFTETDSAQIGRITPSGTVSEFPISGPAYDITAGPDGNLWFVEEDRVGRITTGVTPTVTEFASGLPLGTNLACITAGRDGNLWFTDFANDRIGKINIAGMITLYDANVHGMTAGSEPTAITSGPDGNLWFVEQAGNRIGKMVPESQAITEYPLTAGSYPIDITPGPDGNLWFTERDGNRVGKITTAGVVTEYGTGITAGAAPKGIAAGPDGNLWFTEGAGRIGRITTGGAVTEFTAGLSPSPDLFEMAAGPDGNLWFGERGIDRIGRINTALDPPAFSNPASITIPGLAPSGPASPYPSEISVSGLQGTVTDVRVRLTGFGHTYPSDVDFLLVGPTGQSVILSADRNVARPPVAGVTLNLSDAATRGMTMLDGPRAPYVSGSFKPTDNSDAPIVFPSPAPVAPYVATLSTLDGTNPNGDWELFINDRNNGDAGNLHGGWGLDIDTTGPPVTPPVDPPVTPPTTNPLSLTLSAKPSQRVAKLKVKAICSKACDLSAVAKGKAGEKFKTRAVTGNGTAGTAVTLKPKLAKSVLKEVKGETGKATITVMATDASGGTDAESVKLKLK